MPAEYVPTTEDNELASFVVAYVDQRLGKMRRRRGGGRYEPTEAELFAEARAKIADHDATIRAEVRADVLAELHGPHHSFGVEGTCIMCGATPDPMSDEDVAMVRERVEQARARIAEGTP